MDVEKQRHKRDRCKPGARPQKSIHLNFVNKVVKLLSQKGQRIFKNISFICSHQKYLALLHYCSYKESDYWPYFQLKLSQVIQKKLKFQIKKLASKSIQILQRYKEVLRLVDQNYLKHKEQYQIKENLNVQLKILVKSAEDQKVGLQTYQEMKRNPMDIFRVIYEASQLQRQLKTYEDKSQIAGNSVIEEKEVVQVQGSEDYFICDGMITYKLTTDSAANQMIKIDDNWITNIRMETNFYSESSDHKND